MGTLHNTDIWENSELRYEGRFLSEVIVRAVVKDLEGSGLAVLQDAVVGCGLPDYWHEHPDFPGMHLISKSPEATGPHTANVYLQYVSTRPRIVGASGLDTLQTDRKCANFGNPACGQIVLVHNGEQQPGIITATMPEQTIVIARIEPSRRADPIRGIVPWVKQWEWTGAVNDRLWPPEPHQGFREGFWQVRSVSFNSDGLGRLAYNMRYEFQGRYGGWDYEVVARGDDNLPVVNPGPQARQFIAWHGRANFDELGLY